MISMISQFNWTETSQYKYPWPDTAPPAPSLRAAVKQAKRAKREEVLERQRKRVVELWVIVLKLHMEVQWFPIGLLYIDLYTIIILPNLLGSIIPELIINQQGFWTLPKWLMDVLLW